MKVMPAQFTPHRVTSPEVQALLPKVSTRPNASYTARYPDRMPAKITVRLKVNGTLEQEAEDGPPMSSYPFTWKDAVKKFDQLVADRIDRDLANEIRDAVHRSSTSRSRT
jgi:2-methylcitrate dehydratase